ncbi:hypothetical protein I4U23_010547 [Adineta vaga]|nr:hypothetical protein I4U23_010547 [Adineta vaga]
MIIVLISTFIPPGAFGWNPTITDDNEDSSEDTDNSNELLGTNHPHNEINIA